MKPSRGQAPDVFAYYRFLRATQDYVASRLADDLSLGTVAKAVGLERKYFSALFHSKTGTCFKDWVREQRIRRAMAILDARDESITTVALEVGYQDLRTFERAFLRTTGSTPYAFRKRVRTHVEKSQRRVEQEV